MPVGEKEPDLLLSVVQGVAGLPARGLPAQEEHLAVLVTHPDQLGHGQTLK